MIGIRPGEKLHEIMITTDDARMTFELDDRYIITPAFPFWTRDHLDIEDAVSVAEAFSYGSDINTEWLNLDDIVGMIGENGVG